MAAVITCRNLGGKPYSYEPRAVILVQDHREFKKPHSPERPSRKSKPRNRNRTAKQSQDPVSNPSNSRKIVHLLHHRSKENNNRPKSRWILNRKNNNSHNKPLTMTTFQSKDDGGFAFESCGLADQVHESLVLETRIGQRKHANVKRDEQG